MKKYKCNLDLMAVQPTGDDFMGASKLSGQLACCMYYTGREAASKQVTIVSLILYAHWVYALIGL